ncbi:DUF1801 domain-containing protein [Roseivivax sp. GX 12232]|uniref:DUF1801 domain-containing protein n=1 Tax=Roseivivax sp. GX 12232 TaxID=2900547 RepID=UPI001E558453|nr:DUF1801 domain-containing protein [Roseivivax sp. GX 12232]MCE0504325.1 DUF1801 domain-containing protein [Roseivivax sp. GX 12232]
MAELKTRPTGASVPAFLECVTPQRRRAEGVALDAIFRAATGWEPVLWGESIVGYGSYDYTYASGRSGHFLATGFSPRASALSIYILPGYADFGPLLARLGPHRTGRSCLYVTRLERIDTGVLGELIRAGLEDLARHWPVRGS